VQGRRLIEAARRMDVARISDPAAPLRDCVLA
jgi:3-phenylpropionate/trans-cinnamate dioxygenase ferredoxin reductase subunit